MGVCLACDLRIASDQAKSNGILWVAPGQEARFLAPLDVRKIPGVGKVTEKQVEEIARQKMPDLNAASVEAAIKSVKGTARSMGIEVTA